MTNEELKKLAEKLYPSKGRSTVHEFEIIRSLRIGFVAGWLARERLPQKQQTNELSTSGNASKTG